MTPYSESPNGILVPPSRSGHGLREANAYAVMAELYEAKIADLRIQLQEQDWLRLGEGREELSRDNIGTIVASARAYALKNPLIKRAVDVQASYVWGQDLTYKTQDDNVKAVVDRFWDDNQATLTGQKASRLLEVERSVTGNLFLALFPDRRTGQVRVRQVPFEEVRDIICNPEDRADVWYYRRTWTQRRADGMGDDQMTAFYPDWHHTPESKPATMPWQGQDVPIVWAVPFVHDKSGAFPHWKWGVPDVYAALDWAKAYKTMLENDATRSAALARFAYKLTTEGGSTGVAAAKAKIATTLGVGTAETNPPPVAGSTFIRGSKNQDVEPIDISRAIMPVDHSRPVRLMVAAAVGLSDTILSGDVDQSSLATASSLDRPTELMFNEKRNDRKDLMTALCQFAIDADLMASGGILRGQVSDDARQVDFAFPDLLEQSVTERVTAIVDAATLAGRMPATTIPQETVSRLLMSALNVDNIDDQLTQLEDERAEREKKAAQIAQQTARQPQSVPPNGRQPATEAARTVVIGADELADAVEWWDQEFPSLAGLLDGKLGPDEGGS